MPRENRLLTDLNVSRETHERLTLLVRVTEQWTKKINLVAPSSVGSIWSRHVLDSAQLWLLAPAGARRWIDLGSGGGFPGLVLAVLAAEKSPNAAISLVEADQRKAAFLRHAANTLGVTVTVHARRIEALQPNNYDVVTARALAPLPRLLPLVHRFFGKDTIALLPKGAKVDSELTDALAGWHIRFERVPSRTDPSASILKILELEPLS